MSSLQINIGVINISFLLVIAQFGFGSEINVPAELIYGRINEDKILFSPLTWSIGNKPTWLG